jgi:hypothetical protein
MGLRANPLRSSKEGEISRKANALSQSANDMVPIARPPQRARTRLVRTGPKEWEVPIVDCTSRLFCLMYLNGSEPALPTTSSETQLQLGTWD